MIDLLAKSSELCDDIAWGWILTLFGTEGSGCTTTAVSLTPAVTNSPYANAFAVLTAALAFIGSLFLAYHVLSGIVSSAYTGKVLGERWHQIWAPLRVVFGFGLLIPIGGGFSAVHYILRDVVGLAAVNLGNGVIKTYIKTAFDPTSSYNQSKISSLSGADVVNKFFAMEVCSGVIDQMSSKGFAWWAYESKSPKKWSDQGDDGYTWDYGTCGAINLPLVQTNATEGVFSMPEVKALVAKFNQERLDATEEMRKSLQGKAVTDYAALGEFIDKNGDSIVKSSDSVIKGLREQKIISPAIQDKLDAAAQKWNAKVGAAATNIFAEAAKGSRSGALDSISKYGFMMAGAYERSLSAVSGFVSGIANGTVTMARPDLDEDTTRKLIFATTVVTSTKAVDNKNNQDLSADTSSDPVGTVIRAVFPDNITNMLHAKTSADPVGDMIMFGNNLLTAATYAVLIIVGMKAGGTILGLVGLVSANPVAVGAGVIGALAGEAVAAIVPWIAPAIVTMFLVGLMHSFVLPMIPMIMVFIMGISWLLMFLEGTIAAVLWAFIFIRMDGHEFADQKQSPGIALLFNLLLRPALGMLAFAGMILLLPALLNALNMIWSTAFTLQTGSHSWVSLVWVYQWAAMILIFCWMQWTITMRMASLIPTIADRVGHWMGISSTAGYGDGNETGSTIAGAVAATHYLNRGVQGVIGRGVSAGGGGGGPGRGGNGAGSANADGIGDIAAQKTAARALKTGKVPVQKNVGRGR